MSDRSRKPRRRRAARATTKRRPITGSFTAPEHDPLTDSRLRPLVERYAALAKVSIDEVGPQLLQLQLPPSERSYFDGRDEVQVAFTVSALERSVDAEMAVVGSPFVDQLLAAIRARGTTLALGSVPFDEADAPAPPEIRVRGGSASRPQVERDRRRVGRMLARIEVRAGASLEEHLLESAYFDFASGVPLPEHVAAWCRTLEAETLRKTSRGGKRRAAIASSLAGQQLVDLLAADVQRMLGPRIERLRTEAERTMTRELERIDRYYHELVRDAAVKRDRGEAEEDASRAAAVRAIETEHARRRLEEERRHQLRSIVHPLQLTSVDLIVEQARWTLTGAERQRAVLSALRYHTGGEAPWDLHCPACRHAPLELVVLADGEIGCVACVGDASDSSPHHAIP